MARASKAAKPSKSPKEPTTARKKSGLKASLAPPKKITRPTHPMKTGTSERNDKIKVDINPLLKDLELTLKKAVDKVVKDKITATSAEAVTNGKTQIENVLESKRDALDIVETSFESRHQHGYQATKDKKSLLKKIEQTQLALEESEKLASTAVEKRHQELAKHFKGQINKIVKAL